jgi:hypothetical protein
VAKHFSTSSNHSKQAGEQSRSECARCSGHSPHESSLRSHAALLAQWLERAAVNRKVTGSIPVGSVNPRTLIRICRSILRFDNPYHFAKAKKQRPRSEGDLAQMVERSLSMREALGSMPRFSTGCSVVAAGCEICCATKIQNCQLWGSNPRGLLHQNLSLAP